MKKKIISFLILIIIIGSVLLLSNNLDTGVLAADLMTDGDEMSLVGAILCEAFVTIHMSVFVLFPLAGIINKNKTVKTFIVLFCIRLVTLIIGNTINHTMMMIIDFMAVFFGAFVVVSFGLNK